jgi:radical SAM superfamily enzyme YgiQ (UPF0313 family)
MKILIASLNAKYIHTNLAIRYLKRFTEDITACSVEIRDYTINQPQDQIVHEICRINPSVIALSVYIWNLEATLKLVRKLKKIQTGWTIVLGGPEIGYTPKEMLISEPSIDYIISGEGEIPFRKLMMNEPLSDIEGLAYRGDTQVIVNPKGNLMSIDSLPFPYDLPIVKNKLIYYETSRGCPYQCAYCMSSTIRGVRNKNLNRVKEDLQLFIDQEVPMVKFVDRTFNIDQKRSFEILRYIMEQDEGKTTFHMELSPNLINDDWVDCLKEARKGLFQFEIGIQSTNPKVIAAINRNILFADYREQLSAFLELKNCHSHVDLIAGLPFEDKSSFLKSFDDVYALGADDFQLGFLKLLKGSPLRRHSDDYGYVFDEEPPYEVISCDHITYGELMDLKVIEELLELYDNSQRFEKSVKYIVSFFERPSEFYSQFALHWENKGYFNHKHALIELFVVLFDFAGSIESLNSEYLKESMKFDYHRKNRYRMTEFFGDLVSGVDRQKIHEYLKNEENILRDLPQFKGKKTKEILKHIQVIRFKYDILSEAVEEKEIWGYFDYYNDKFGMIRTGEYNE